MMPVGSQSTEEVDQNYVPMSANSPSHHHSGSLSEPVHEANYVPMTPSTMEFSSLGKQVPPPAHMGFRSSPKTPPRRPILSDCQPPPVDRNLKPDRKGERRKGVHDSYSAGLSRSCVVKLNRMSHRLLALTQQLTMLFLTLGCYRESAGSWSCSHLYKAAQFPTIQSQSSVFLHHTSLIISVYTNN